MPFHTPNGLKIRFDPNAISEIVQTLVVCHEMNNILLDVERWENLPVGFNVVSASVAAWLSGSVEKVSFGVRNSQKHRLGLAYFFVPVQAVIWSISTAKGDRMRKATPILVFLFVLLCGLFSPFHAQSADVE